MQFDQSLVNGLFTLCGLLGGWILKIIWDAVSDLKKDMRQLEVNLPELYVRKDDFRDIVHELRADMMRGFDKLDQTIVSIFKKIDIVSRRD